VFIDDIRADRLRSAEMAMDLVWGNGTTSTHIATVGALERKVIPAADEGFEE
jgi:hypothetical protein